MENAGANIRGISFGVINIRTNQKKRDGCRQADIAVDHNSI